MDRITNGEEIYYEITKETLLTVEQAQKIYENVWIERINSEIEAACKKHEKQIVIKPIPNWLKEKLDLNGFCVETIIINGYHKSKISWF